MESPFLFDSEIGTIFLLADRPQCGGKRNRSVIVSRSFLATRAEVFTFAQMLCAQAIRQGRLCLYGQYLGQCWN